MSEADYTFGKHREVLEEHQKTFGKQKTDLEYLYALASEKMET